MIAGSELGATDCACAAFGAGVAELILNSPAHEITPSAAGIDGDLDRAEGRWFR